MLKKYMYFALNFLMGSISVVNSTLHSKLNHFEILKPSHLKVRVRRDVTTGCVKYKHLSFSALRTPFNLHLIPGSPVVDPANFEANLVDARGHAEKFDVDPNDFYTGTVRGHPDGFVDASYVEGVWSAQIHTSVDTFYIEPLTKHDELGSEEAMVIYRIRDIKSSNSSESANQLSNQFCSTIPVNQSATDVRDENWSRFGRYLTTADSRSSKAEWHLRNSNGRVRVRRSRVFNTCDIKAVMDTVTFRGIGRGSPYKSAALLLYWYQLVDRIYSNTDFQLPGGARLLVRSIVILKEFTPLHHKRWKINYDPAVEFLHSYPLMDHMAEELSFAKYCLAHLTTQREMDTAILGLAYIGNNPKNEGAFWRSGLCAASIRRAYNVGFSRTSVKSSTFLDLKYTMALAHELGHGWGASHDSEGAGCAPTEIEGGKYIMWKRENPGGNLNNLLFSKCSIIQIRELLKYKAHKCLLPGHVQVHVCGDGIIDDKEECDEGNTDNHPCCTSSCRLRSNATCSPSSSPCCTDDCRVAPTTQTCLKDLKEPCLADSHCDGVQFETCPKSNPLPNGMPCGDIGTCWFGECLNYCANKSRASDPPIQLEPCPCVSEMRAGCSICCQTSGKKNCEVMPVFHPDGTVCPYGFCNGGICEVGLEKKYKSSLKNMFLARELRKSPFFSNLIIFTVAILTVMYIIAAVCFHCLERKWVAEAKQKKKETGQDVEKAVKKTTKKRTRQKHIVKTLTGESNI